MSKRSTRFKNYQKREAGSEEDNTSFSIIIPKWQKWEKRESF